MASTYGLSARLHAMEARLDCMTNTVEQLRSRMDAVDTAMRQSTAINNAMLDIMYQLQPLAYYLSPLSNAINPRASSGADSGLGDMASNNTEEGEINDTCSISARPAPLRRRRARSNLKRMHDTILSLTAAKTKVAEVMEVEAMEAEAMEAEEAEDQHECEGEVITICMLQDAPQKN